MLAFDCSGERRSAALLEDDAIVAFTEESGARRHAERLVAQVDELLADAGADYASIDVIAAVHGPGSFTGVRVAVAAARAWALVLDRPVLAVDGREALLAAMAPTGAARVAAIDARRGGVYVAWSGEVDDAPTTALAPVDVVRAIDGPLSIAGSGAQLVAAEAAGRASLDPATLDARAVAAAARLRLQLGERPAPGSALTPLYLRAPDAVAGAA
ncbi:MAG: tRNA (adenosine(37)-N6)-threonylcarbamoyltransferase complex dimerization subunit type 1 TsaB [Pseudomonadota bacterium]